MLGVLGGKVDIAFQVVGEKAHAAFHGEQVAAERQQFGLARGDAAA